MLSNTLARRIEAATGITVPVPADQHKLSGIFNRYRPDGAGIENLIGTSGVEGEVLLRIKEVFLATASSWQPSDLYFKIRKFSPTEKATAAALLERYLMDFARFSNYVGDADIGKALSEVKVVSEVQIGVPEDTDLPNMMYECLTDFLAQQQPDRHELLLLKEAVYSMANDYFLMAYVLWPVLGLEGEVGDTFDAYFQLWRSGIGVKFFRGGIVCFYLPI